LNGYIEREDYDERASIRGAVFHEGDGGEKFFNNQILIVNKAPTRRVVPSPKKPGTEGSEFDPWLRASDHSLFEESENHGSGEHESNLGHLCETLDLILVLLALRLSWQVLILLLSLSFELSLRIAWPI
jgi:hypothetical protein